MYRLAAPRSALACLASSCTDLRCPTLPLGALPFLALLCLPSPRPAHPCFALLYLALSCHALHCLLPGIALASAALHCTPYSALPAYTCRNQALLLLTRLCAAVSSLPCLIPLPSAALTCLAIPSPVLFTAALSTSSFPVLPTLPCCSRHALPWPPRRASLSLPCTALLLLSPQNLAASYPDLLLFALSSAWCCTVLLILPCVPFLALPCPISPCYPSPCPALPFCPSPCTALLLLALYTMLLPVLLPYPALLLLALSCLAAPCP